ncbi:MAG: hypothetical protein MI746_12180 [Pseudomonadales bacterium]|nr:hypothetical protein [Pseudomonadales bacterium]
MNGLNRETRSQTQHAEAVTATIITFSDSIYSDKLPVIKTQAGGNGKLQEQASDYPT